MDDPDCEKETEPEVLVGGRPPKNASSKSQDNGSKSECEV